jgi:hypothetical protein
VVGAVVPERLQNSDLNKVLEYAPVTVVSE